MEFIFPQNATRTSQRICQISIAGPCNIVLKISWGFFPRDCFNIQKSVRAYVFFCMLKLSIPIYFTLDRPFKRDGVFSFFLETNGQADRRTGGQTDVWRALKMMGMKSPYFLFLTSTTICLVPESPKLPSYSKCQTDSLRLVFFFFFVIYVHPR